MRGVSRSRSRRAALALEGGLFAEQPLPCASHEGALCTVRSSSACVPTPLPLRRGWALRGGHLATPQSPRNALRGSWWEGEAGQLVKTDMSHPALIEGQTAPVLCQLIGGYPRFFKKS